MGAGGQEDSTVSFPHSTCSRRFARLLQKLSTKYPRVVPFATKLQSEHLHLHLYLIQLYFLISVALRVAVVAVFP